MQIGIDLKTNPNTKEYEVYSNEVFIDSFTDWNKALNCFLAEEKLRYKENG